MTPEIISSAPIRYIKLGVSGRWAKRSFAQNEIHFGHSDISHDLALTGDKDAIVSEHIAQGRTQGKARDFARELLDFYHLPEEAIWITFEQGMLWWTQATCEVHLLGTSCADHGKRMRKTVFPWRNTDLKGNILSYDTLSTKLTKVAAYRQTLCSVSAEDYLRHKLIGEDIPVVAEAVIARKAAVLAAANMISTLHWADFETLIDLILARSGWFRNSPLGGHQKDADLFVEQIVTGETALVQVKSAASQVTLDDYVSRFDAMASYSRLIFACHTPTGDLDSKARDDITLWTRNSLAESVMRNGLFDWLVARVG